MEPYQTSPIDTQLQQPWVKWALLAATVLMAIAAVALLYFAIAGYGTVHFEGIPADATVSLNGHTVTTTTLRLRPGIYQLAITSPTINPYESTLHVSLFQQTVSQPKPQPRDVNAIASSLIGAIPGTSIPPQLANVRWFENNTWVAGMLAPTDSILVMHYDASQKQWSVALSNNPGYPNNPSSLPTDVAAYVQPLLAGGDIAEGIH